MSNQDITDSSFLFVWTHILQFFECGNILCSLFSGNLSHSNCHNSNKYLFIQDFKSVKGMSSSEMLPQRASAKFPLMPRWPGTQIKIMPRWPGTQIKIMPRWPGTQIKTISFPSLVNSIIYDLVPKGVQMGGRIFDCQYIYISKVWPPELSTDFRTIVLNFKYNIVKTKL